MAKDLFSAQAADYAKYRPAYPVELVDYLLPFVAEKNMAWDCATGNGQAAILLAPHFKQVMATDISEKQLSLAVSKENITYQVCKAEQTPFADNSFDLITIAQAYHWFRFAEFEREARRVGRPGAVIAAWTYSLPVCGYTAIDNLVTDFYSNTVGPYWDAERKYVEEQYQTVPFPFDPLPAKTFGIDVHWTKEDLAGYLQTWSSVQHFAKANGYNPVQQIIPQITHHWPTERSSMLFTFPVFLIAGTIKK